MSLFSIPQFTGHVTVIGDVMLDRYWSGSSSRISPEAPVPVVNINKTEDRAGGAANVALNIASLQAPCTLIGIVGCDEAALKLKNFVQEHNINAQFVECKDLPTITKLRVLSRNQQLIRLDFEEGFASIDQSFILHQLRQAISKTNVLICSDYGKGALVSIEKMIRIANDANVPVLIDPKGTDFKRYTNATLLTPNLSEFEAVAGKVKDVQDLEQKALKMIDELNLKALLVTRSEDGMSLIQKGKAPVHLPTQAREVYDVTGAGDTVIASLGAALACGLDLISACEISNKAAGIVVGKLGTSVASIQELKDAFSTFKPASTGIVTEDELMKKVSSLKALKKKIVMTNGCFDILHQGHVDYLKKARALGDILIVAVNSDASVQALKGPTRPIIPLDNRMYLLEALACVDYVVAFDEITPERLIAKVLPDILVKGGDYRIDQIAGHKQVLDNGGQVLTIDLVANQSTSNIVKKIKENC